MENEATIQLFTQQDPGSNVTKVELSEGFGKAHMIGAALAIRNAGLPYQPVLEPEQEQEKGCTALPYAWVEFQIESQAVGIAVQQTIPALLMFPQNPEMKPVSFQTGLFIGGFSEHDAQISHTPGFQMDQGELTNILVDAFYEDSITEEHFPDWADLKRERERFWKRMWNVATTILKSRENGFRKALHEHLARFDPGLAGYPDSPVETVFSDQDGALRATFTPGAKSGKTAA